MTGLAYAAIAHALALTGRAERAAEALAARDALQLPAAPVHDAEILRSGLGRRPDAADTR